MRKRESHAHARFSSDSPRCPKSEGLNGGWCSLLRTILCVRFPEHQGKYRESVDSRAQIHLVGRKKTARMLRFFRKFPSNRNRELNEAIREVKVPVPFPNRVLTPCIPVLYGPGDSNDFSHAFTFCATSSLIEVHKKIGSAKWVT
jgi:hypothetical protein